VLYLFLRIWILQLNQIWKRLARRVDEDVKINPDRHSSIYLPNGFFIAGGRFTELYYWDSYWIIRGKKTSTNQITIINYKNMVQIINNFFRSNTV